MKTKIRILLPVFLFIGVASAFFFAKSVFAMSFSAQVGGALPAAQTFTVQNNTASNGDCMNWTASSNVSWLSLSPTSGGCLASGAGQTVSVQPNTTSPAGNYSATITVAGTSISYNGSAINSTQSVGVSYTISSTPPSCTINSFSPAAGGSVNSPLSYNTGTTLSWSTSNCSSATLNGGRFNNQGEAVNSSDTTGNLTSTTTYTLFASGNTSTSTTTTVYVTSACTGTFSAAASPINPGTSTTLNWTTSNCSGNPKIYGGSFGNAPGTQMGSASGSTSTGAVNSNTTYTLTASGPGSGNNITLTAVVNVNAQCTVNVNSTYNGVFTNPPGGYSYSLVGPGQSVTGTGAASYNETPSAQNWIVTYLGGSTAYFSSYTPSQSQSCTSAGGSITFTLNFTDLPPGNPTGACNGAGGGGCGQQLPTPTNYNSSGNPPSPWAAPICGQVLLLWGAGSNATSYNLYRSTNSSSPGGVWQNTTSLNYTDTTALAGTTYYYWVQSQNAYGQSSQVQFQTFGVTPLRCQVDFSTSDKVVTQVNSTNLTYNSSCITSQSGAPTIIKNNDTLAFSIDLCNTGTWDANNVTLTDDLTNTNLSNLTVTGHTGGSSFSTSTSGSVVTFNFGTIGQGRRGIVTFTAKVTAPVGNSQKLLRTFNAVNISYTSTAPAPFTGGCTGTYANGSLCQRSTGYLVFYNGVKAPTIKEVNP